MSILYVCFVFVSDCSYVLFSIIIEVYDLRTVLNFASNL